MAEVENSNVVSISAATGKRDRRKVKPGAANIVANKPVPIDQSPHFASQELINKWIDTITDMLDVLEDPKITQYLKAQKLERRIPLQLTDTIEEHLSDLINEIYEVTPLELANLDSANDEAMFLKTGERLPSKNSPYFQDMGDMTYFDALQAIEQGVESIRGLIYASRVMAILRLKINTTNDAVTDTLSEIFAQLDLQVANNDSIVAFESLNPRIQKDIAINCFFDELPLFQLAIQVRQESVARTVPIESETNQGFTPVLVSNTGAELTYPVSGHLFEV